METQVTKKIATIPGRQGDVMLVAVASIPSNVVEVPRERGSVVLAYGEATGHKHRIPHRSATLYRSESDVDLRFLKIGGAGATLLHDEHSKLRIPPGTYRVLIQRTWSDADEAVNVSD